MNKAKFQVVLQNHKEWLKCEGGGVRANLSGADLHSVSLCGANLGGANLHSANLCDADLFGANLHSANLCGANLLGADLSGANLRGANLYKTSLHGANLHGAYLPSPTMMLLASWGSVSKKLTQDLMRFDASCHENPQSFVDWALNGGDCPYDNVKYQRVSNFQEEEHLITEGFLEMEVSNAYQLMIRLMQEVCRDERYGRMTGV